MTVSLRQSLGLEDYSSPNVYISDDERLYLEKSFIESSYDLNKIIAESTALSQDMQTVNSYQNLLEENNADHIATECISVGLNHLLDKYSIRTNTSVTSLESITSSLETGFKDAGTTLGSIFEGIKTTAKNIIRLILDKLKEWKNKFIAFFRKIFLSKRKSDNAKVKDRVDKVNDIAKEQPEKVKDDIRNTTTSDSVTVNDVIVKNNEVTVVVTLDDLAIDKLLFAAEAHERVLDYKSFLYTCSSTILTAIVNRSETDPDPEEYVYDVITNAKFHHKPLTFEKHNDYIRYIFGHRYIDILFDEQEKSLEEVRKSEPDDILVSKYFNAAKSRLAGVTNNSLVLDARQVNYLVKMQDNLLNAIQAFIRDSDDLNKVNLPNVDNEVTTNLEVLVRLYADTQMDVVAQMMAASNMISEILGIITKPADNI